MWRTILIQGEGGPTDPPPPCPVWLHSCAAGAEMPGQYSHSYQLASSPREIPTEPTALQSCPKAQSSKSLQRGEQKRRISHLEGNFKTI